MVFEYDFEYSPDLETFHEFIVVLREAFPYIYHSHLPPSGRFRGFPNGVIVFAKRDKPRLYQSTDRYASGKVCSTVPVVRRIGKPKVPRRKKQPPLSDTSYWDRFKKADAPPSPLVSTEEAQKKMSQGWGCRPKRRCVGLGVELDHTKALDSAGYLRAFRFARGSSYHRQTKLIPAEELSDIEDEMDMSNVIPEKELNSAALTGLPKNLNKAAES